MKVVGISNGNFNGVTVATQANCHEWVDVRHLDNVSRAQLTVRSILEKEPDVLLVGGWSKGYTFLLQDIRQRRYIPTIGCYHGSLYHGTVFNDDVHQNNWLRAHQHKLFDKIAFVDPRTACYYTHIRKIDAAFLPHAFIPQPQ